MTRAGEILYLVFRVICYCALALVVAGFGSFMVLGALDVCPRFGPTPSPGAPESRAGRTLRIVFKYVLIAFGVLILIGFIGGLVGGVMG